MEILSRKILYQTPFLEVVEINYRQFQEGEIQTWYGVSRIHAVGAVSIAAVTKNNELILIRQSRPMVSSTVLSLPAGLLDRKEESIIDAAKRELLEETGYEANHYEILLGEGKGCVISPGITDERFALVACREAKRVAEPKEDEQTIPFLFPLLGIDEQLRDLAKTEEVDYKTFGTVLLIKQWHENRR